MAARPAAARQDPMPSSRARRFELAALPVRAELAAGMARACRDDRSRLRAADETTARRLAESFAAYLRACKRRRARAVDLAAGPLPDAGRPRRLAGADLRAAAEARAEPRPRRLAAGDDGAPLRGLQDACGQAVLPRAYRPARPPDRAGRRPAGAQRRPGGDGRPGTRADRNPRLLPAGPRQLPDRLVLAPHRPHPDRRDQGRPSASRKP